ncbi:MAG: FliH/SctL family protein [Desulfatiglandales bacterium]
MIEEHKNVLFQFEDFEAEEIQQESSARPSEGDGGCIELPVCGPRRLQGESKEKDGASQDPGDDREDLDTQLARLEREAYEKGFEQGQRDGVALEERQIEEKGKQLEALFSKIRDLRKNIYAEAEKEVLQLSTLIAKKIIRKEISLDPQVIARTIRAALEHLVDKSRLRILINPDDMEEVRRILPEIANQAKGGEFHVVEDHSIERGGCILESGFGRINATLEDQLEMLQEEIEEEFKCAPGETA